MTRVIGLGNLERGDDAAGILTARRLGAIEHPGEPIDLLELWRPGDILVDAAITGSRPGTIHKWNAASLPPAARGCRTSHALSLFEVIRLAAELGRLPAGLTIIGIEAGQFAPGSEPSAAVSEAIDNLVQILSGSFSRSLA